MEEEIHEDLELEERGGLQKLKDLKAERAEQARLDRASYRLWFQTPCWFDEDAAGEVGSQAVAPKGAGYAELKEWLAKGVGTDKLLKSNCDGSNFERLRHRADHLYFLGKYEESAECFLRILGTYKVLGECKTQKQIFSDGPLESLTESS
jgi:hypothetical protein